MAIKKDRLRELAQDFYVQNINATQQEIAEMYGVTPRTLGVWKEKYKWEDLRRDYHSSPVRIKKLLQDEVLSIANGNEAKFNSDAIAKLMSAIERLEKRIDPTVVAKLLKELDNFTAKIDPEFAEKATKFHRQFLLHRIGLLS